jgi:hypothetical protein
LTLIKKYPEYILLFLFAFIGIFTVSSYGYAWDENDQRDIGVTCYNYIFNPDYALGIVMRVESLIKQTLF